LCVRNTERWQCGKGCTEQLWSASPGFKFNIDPNTMLAPPPSEYPTDFRIDSGFATNHPRCINCGGAARPSILFFQDDVYVEGERT